MKADAIIEIRLKTTTEGGRQSAIKGGIYACPLFVDGEGFDCRLLIGSEILQLGETYQVSVKFLNPDMVLPKLLPGKSITLWEGKEIATGKVLKLLMRNSQQA
ncbi:MAG TPA: hypothetical protein VN328_04630 [Thermodesulfovibrionales bacterium]|nr:hypothetical protein [Thermodesulfovibrionales bacterium]